MGTPMVGAVCLVYHLTRAKDKGKPSLGINPRTAQVLWFWQDWASPFDTGPVSADDGWTSHSGVCAKAHLLPG
jgi:hypothetical protein